ncbi:MAG: ABC transporter ATP-binding protein [Planctomycetes bacterium]|nr:ABC transporter ATP-binding protein [Planctomycetota bacterium]
MVDTRTTQDGARLRAEGVHFAYPQSAPVLNGVDLAIHGGELVALFGPNGAGKSTLLKVMGGLLAPSSGRVLVGGESIESWSAIRRARHLARMPQGLDAWPDMSVGDLVRSGRYCHQPRRTWRGLFMTDASPGDAQAVDRAIEATDIAAWIERSVRELSGGERERVLMARALAQGSEVLLADEPTRSLDPAHQLEAFELLRGQAREGKAVLVVTHDWNLASQFADRLVCLSEGRVVAEGTPKQVLQPAVLAPVFGSRLHFGSLPAAEAAGDRPFVLPWSGAEIAD